MTGAVELAACVEASAGPDDDLDREIWLVVVADDNQRELVRVGRSLHGDDEAAFRIDRMMDGLRYTSSLDAAMSLVPEGRIVTVGGGLSIGTAVIADEDGDNCFGSKAATPALALTAACLKARAQKESGK